MIRPLIPNGFEGAITELAASPGIVSGDHIFLTGMTGSRADGSMPEGIEAQAQNAFDKIGRILAEAGASHAAIVEITSYHIDLSTHFEEFNRVRRNYLSDPFPAWTAVGVASLRRPGALVEIRAVAQLPST